MAHILILEALIEMLEAYSNPSTAITNLLAACQAGRDYAHGANPDPEIVGAITDLSTFVYSYMSIANPPSDIRIQSYANMMNSIVPD